MRFFHEQVKTDCVYCHGGGCVHCASRHLTRITGEVVVGILDGEQMERLIDCLNGRPQLVLKLTIAVPGLAQAEKVWERFCEGRPPAFMGDMGGGMFAAPGEVPVPASRGSRGRLKALFSQMERANPEPQELQHARSMMRRWSHHGTAYAAEREAHWRGEVERLEAEEGADRPDVTDRTAGPLRIVLQRKKGWRMPDNTVKVDRSTRWGNPFKVGDLVTGIPGLCKSGSAERRLETTAEAVHCYQCWLEGIVTLYSRRPPDRWELQDALRGKNLACWCKAGEPCHADVLLGIANGEEEANG